MNEDEIIDAVVRACDYSRGYCVENRRKLIRKSLRRQGIMLVFEGPTTHKQ